MPNQETMAVPKDLKEAIGIKFRMERGDRDCLKDALHAILKCSAKNIDFPGLDKEQRTAFDRAIIFGTNRYTSEALDIVAREMSMLSAARIFYVVDSLRIAAESQMGVMGPASIIVQESTGPLSPRVCRRLLSLSERANGNGSPGRLVNNYLEIIQHIMVTGQQISDLSVDQRELYVQVKSILDPVNLSPYDSGTQSASSLSDAQGTE
jgi:hypothetical protein